MMYASSTVAAMEKHRGEAELVRSGLRLLANLAEADENKVRLLQTFQKFLGCFRRPRSLPRRCNNEHIRIP